MARVVMFGFRTRSRDSSKEFASNPAAAELLDHCLRVGDQDPRALVLVVPKLLPSFFSRADVTERGRLFKALTKCLRHGEDVEQFVRALFKSVSPDTAARYLAIGRRQEPLPHTVADVRIVVASVAEARLLRAEPGSTAETEAWVAALETDSVVYDIGAGIGIVSLLAAAPAGRHIRAFAFEPAYFNFAALCENITLNGLTDRVVPLQAAVTDGTGIGPFFCRVVERGTGEHSFGRAVNRGGNPFDPEIVSSVAGLRLDDAISSLRLPPPTHLMIDVDGAEMEALQGAEGTLQSVDLRIVTVAPAHRERSEAIEHFLTRFGWLPEPERVTGNRLTTYRRRRSAP